MTSNPTHYFVPLSTTLDVAAPLVSPHSFCNVSETYEIIDRQFACPRCKKRYRYRSSVGRHMKYECGTTPQFVCSICYKSFTQRSSLKSHTFSLHGFEALKRLTQN
ncbi:hypothetical protein MTP99_008528 [Tenebrio molitor]|nr:hypothetical protein MTP99_008528 [Tenebrio molitor]